MQYQPSSLSFHTVSSPCLSPSLPCIRVHTLSHSCSLCPHACQFTITPRVTPAYCNVLHSNCLPRAFFRILLRLSFQSDCKSWCKVKKPFIRPLFHSIHSFFSREYALPDYLLFRAFQPFPFCTCFDLSLSASVPALPDSVQLHLITRHWRGVLDVPV